MNLTQRILINVTYQGLAKVISLAISLWMARLIFFYLQPAGMGQYSAVVSFLQIFIVLLGFGTTLILIRKLGQTKERRQIDRLISEIFSLHLFSSLIFIFFTFLFSFTITRFSPLERWGILLTSLFFIFLSFNNVLAVIFQRELKTQWLAWGEILCKVLGLFWIYLAIWQDWGVLGMLMALVVTSGFNFGWLWQKSKKYATIRIINNLSFLKSWLKESWPIALGLVFSMIYFKGDTVILKIFRSDEEVGYYGLPYKILETLIIFPPLFINLVMPRLAAAWQAKNLLWLKKAIWKSSAFLFFIAVFLVIFVFIFSRPIVLFFSGENFIPAIVLLKILIVATGLMFLGEFFKNLLVTLGRQKLLLLINIFISLLALLGYLIFIPAYGAVAAAVVTLICELLLFIIFLCFLSWRFIF